MSTCSVKKGRRFPNSQVGRVRIPPGPLPENSTESAEEGPEWRQVVGFPPYEVSTHGQIRRDGRELKQFAVHRDKDPDLRTYRAIQFCVNGVVTQRTVHSVVAETFIGPRPDGYEIDHWDGDDTNNRLDNLEYVTPNENMRRATERHLTPVERMIFNGFVALGIRRKDAYVYLRKADKIAAVESQRGRLQSLHTALREVILSARAVAQ